MANCTAAHSFPAFQSLFSAQTTQQASGLSGGRISPFPPLHFKALHAVRRGSFATRPLSSENRKKLPWASSRNRAGISLKTGWLAQRISEHTPMSALVLPKAQATGLAARGTSFGIGSGEPSPLGVSRQLDAVNFAIFSEHATSVTLCLTAEPTVEIDLDSQGNKTGNVWQISVEDIPFEGVLYGYRVNGPQGWDEGHRFDGSRVLLDPYSKYVEGRRIFGDFSQKDTPFLGTYDLTLHQFDWGDDYKLPAIPEKDLVVYEMNVRAFTGDESSGLDPKIRGSYLGVIEKIPHLVELGVNAVELLPGHEFDEMEFQRFKNPRDHMAMVEITRNIADSLLTKPLKEAKI